jgi:uncharacterized cupredoxin-like copper-binding protein
MIKRWSMMLGVAALCALLIFWYGRASQAPTSSPVQIVQVTENDFSIHASQTSFQPGVRYHFVVTNISATPHEFMIGPQMPAGMAMEAMHQMALAHIDTIAPHQTSTVDVTFPMAMGTPMPGMSSMTTQRLEFSCHLAGHYEAGMELPLTVSAL